MKVLHMVEHAVSMCIAFVSIYLLQWFDCV